MRCVGDEIVVNAGKPIILAQFDSGPQHVAQAPQAGIEDSRFRQIADAQDVDLVPFEAIVQPIPSRLREDRERGFIGRHGHHLRHGPKRVQNFRKNGVQILRNPQSLSGGVF